MNARASLSTSGLTSGSRPPLSTFRRFDFGVGKEKLTLSVSGPSRGKSAYDCAKDRAASRMAPCQLRKDLSPCSNITTRPEFRCNIARLLPIGRGSPLTKKSAAVMFAPRSALRSAARRYTEDKTTSRWRSPYSSRSWGIAGASSSSYDPPQRVLGAGGHLIAVDLRVMLAAECLAECLPALAPRPHLDAAPRAVVDFPMDTLPRATSDLAGLFAHLSHPPLEAKEQVGDLPFPLGSGIGGPGAGG